MLLMAENTSYLVIVMVALEVEVRLVWKGRGEGVSVLLAGKLDRTRPSDHASYQKQMDGFFTNTNLRALGVRGQGPGWQS